MTPGSAKTADPLSPHLRIAKSVECYLRKSQSESVTGIWAILWQVRRGLGRRAPAPPAAVYEGWDLHHLSACCSVGRKVPAPPAAIGSSPGISFTDLHHTLSTWLEIEFRSNIFF